MRFRRRGCGERSSSIAEGGDVMESADDTRLAVFSEEIWRFSRDGGRRDGVI